jgi:hypothetical protein
MWLANMTFTLSRDWITWVRGLLVTRLSMRRRIVRRRRSER